MLTSADIGAAWEFVGTGDYLNGSATDFLMRDTASGTLRAGSVADGVASFTILGEEFSMRG